MATIKVPPVLRPSVGGEKEVAADGETVGAVLQSLASQHPATESQLFSEEATSSMIFATDMQILLAGPLCNNRSANGT